ncbi:hypothetical protein LXL04_037558 [Taraxacum kok-saghyz]
MPKTVDRHACNYRNAQKSGQAQCNDEEIDYLIPSRNTVPSRNRSIRQTLAVAKPDRSSGRTLAVRRNRSSRNPSSRQTLAVGILAVETLPYQSREDAHSLSRSGEEVVSETPFQTDHNDYIPSDSYDHDFIDIQNEEEIPMLFDDAIHQDEVQEDQNVPPMAENVPPMNIPTRSSTRVPRKPSWYNDYVMHWSQGPLNEGIPKPYSSPHSPPTYPYIESTLLTETHKSFLCSVSKINEPKFYEEACLNTE